MQKENVLDASSAVAAPEEVETHDASEIVESVAKAEPEVQKTEKLSLRDSLEVAVEATKDLKKNDKTITSARKSNEKSGQGDLGNTGKSVSSSPLQPPAEYTDDERADFSQLSPKGQEAQLRLHKSRVTYHEQIKREAAEVKREAAEVKREAAELQWVKDLTKEVTPYLQAVGEKIPTHEALIKALKMHREFNTNDPRGAAATYLRARGVEVPDALLSKESSAKTDPQITSLQEELSRVTSRLAQEDQARERETLQSAWSAFESEKNAAGELKHPDVGNTEPGLALASNIGSLVLGKTDLSKQFIANAQARIPNLTYPRLIQEAYKWYGGKVADAEAPRPQSQESTKEHIAKSRRAASSVPGSGVRTASNGTSKKFKDYRSAAAAAIAELKEAEG